MSIISKKCNKVYDVSNSYHWRKGVHQAMHHAGHDLSNALKQAPHGIHLLDKFPTIGEIEQMASES